MVAGVMAPTGPGASTAAARGTPASGAAAASDGLRTTAAPASNAVPAMNLRLEVRPIPVSLPSPLDNDPPHSNRLSEQPHAELDGCNLLVDGCVRRQIETQVQRQRSNRRPVAQAHPRDRSKDEGTVEARIRPEISRFEEHPEIEPKNGRKAKLGL